MWYVLQNCRLKLRRSRVLPLGHVAVDVKWVLGQIIQVLQHDEKKSSAVDSRQVEPADVARILTTELKANHSACNMSQNARLQRLEEDETIDSLGVGQHITAVST